MPENLRRFALMVSILNTIAFWMATASPTIVDPLLEPLRSQMYKVTSTYTLGPYIFLFGVPVGFLTYFFNAYTIVKDYQKGLLTSLILLLAAFATLPNFDPFPHPHVFQVALAFSPMIGAIVQCYNHKFELGALDDVSVSELARTERVKLEYETWFRGLVIIVTIVVAILGITVLRSFENAIVEYSPGGKVTEETLRAARLQSMSVMVNSAFFGICLVIFIRLVVKRILELSGFLCKIKAVRGFVKE